MPESDLNPSRVYLQKLFDYDPETGIFRWKRSRGRVSAGSVAGTLNHDGYRHIKVDGHSYAAHRLAWVCFHGSFPRGPIEHRNGVHDDNRMVNLQARFVEDGL